MKIQFEEVKLKATRRWIEDGRKRQETRTFSQTIRAGKIFVVKEINNSIS